MADWGWILLPLVLALAFVLERLPAARRFRRRRWELHEARKDRHP